MSPGLEEFVTRPFPYDHAPACGECDGHGYTCYARDWQRDKCDACDGTGYAQREEV